MGSGNVGRGNVGGMRVSERLGNDHSNKNPTPKIRIQIFARNQRSPPLLQDFPFQKICLNDVSRNEYSFGEKTKQKRLQTQTSNSVKCGTHSRTQIRKSKKPETQTQKSQFLVILKNS